MVSQQGQQSRLPRAQSQVPSERMAEPQPGFSPHGDVL